eukprot:SM000163S02294  [mRNA]  locus=s163:61724:63448:+ [translate_table: standard]
MARSVAVVALLLACLVAPAVAHYAKISGVVMYSACADGKMTSPAAKVQVSLTCDIGFGDHTVFTRTDAAGKYHFNNVPTVQNWKTFVGCSVKISKTYSDYPKIASGGPKQVLDPKYGKLLQYLGDYKIPTMSVSKAVVASSCLCKAGGSLCGDPRLVGGDGVPFWFHGRRDADFCIVSERNLHINAHFIGKSAGVHDLTWVQAVVIMYDNHKLYVGAQQEAVWSPQSDHLLFVLDGQPLLPVSNTAEEVVYEAADAKLTIKRAGKANSGRLEIEGLMAMNVEIHPIAKSNWTEDSCFAHMDMSMEFGQLSGRAEGVLGQTYQKLWSPPNEKEGTKVTSYILHDIDSYTSSGLFNADCPVSVFENAPFESINSVWRKAIVDDVEEIEEASSSLCSNDRTSGGLRCTSRR